MKIAPEYGSVITNRATLVSTPRNWFVARRSRPVLHPADAPAARTPLAASAAKAGDAESCKAVRFADVGWTDIQVITGIASTLFDALGYQSEVKTLSVPVTYASMKNKDIDVFLGNWMPSMTADVKPYFDDKSVEQLQPANLEGAGYGLVVPQYVADAGIKSVADLAANKDKFSGKFYGIESGNDGNRIIQTIIADAKNNLAGWELVESCTWSLCGKGRDERRGSR